MFHGNCYDFRIVAGRNGDSGSCLTDHVMLNEVKHPNSSGKDSCVLPTGHPALSMTPVQFVPLPKTGTIRSMNNLSYRLPPSTPSSLRVRWTLWDLLTVGAVTILLAAIALLALRLPGLLGSTALRDALRNNLLISGMIAGALVYGFAALATQLVIVRRNHGSWRDIGFRAAPSLAIALLPVMFIAEMILLGVINLAVVAVIGQFENPQTAALTDPRGFSWANFIVVFIVGAIIAPPVEELLFRGLLYQWLRARTNVAVAVIASAAIFATVHFIPVLLPVLFAVGVILAVAFEWSKSLWVNIGLHFLQNAFAISLLFLIQANPQLLQPR